MLGNTNFFFGGFLTRSSGQDGLLSINPTTKEFVKKTAKQTLSFKLKEKEVFFF